jgi:uncharacterized protein (DUF58 family)
LGLFLLGTNYQNNLMTILCYFLLALFLLNLFVSYLNFAKLLVQLGKTHNGFVNDSIQLPLWIHQKGTEKEPPHGTLEVGFWRQAPSLTVDLDKSDNPAYLSFQCEKRGTLRLPRITLSSFYPLGLFRCWTHLAFEHDILVYPAPLPCPVTLRQSLHDQQQESAGNTQPGHDDFDSLAAYRQGEPLHHVAWKQLAKGQGMITKQFSSPMSSVGWLTLFPLQENQLERRLSQLCYQVLELTQSGEKFGLDLGSVKLSPDHGLAHQQKCLKALALYPNSMDRQNESHQRG